MRRLFFALWPNEETRAALAESSRPALRACGGRTVTPGRYHVTLAFLGDLPRAQADLIPAALSVALAPFAVIFDHFGSFAGRGRPRVLWFGPSENPEGLATLATELRGELDRAGVDYDRRDFRPHVTLARKVTKLPELNDPQPVAWPVHDFVLVESKLTPDGPA